MKIDFYAKTDIGRIRKENQDAYGIMESRNLFFVCDGVGGHAAGDFASRVAVEIILQSYEMLHTKEIYNIFKKQRFQEEISRLFSTIRLANRAICKFSEKYPKLSGMGTTIAGVIFDEERNIVHIYHVGDSRVYRLRGDAFEQLTKDHSKINELLESGKITEEEAKTAELKSMITRALGMQPKIKIDYRVEPVLNNDYFILCTDGLSNEVEDNKIKQIITENKENISLACEQLIDVANNSGGSDNITVIIIKVSDILFKPVSSPQEIQFSRVITIDEETQQELVTENKILKRILSKLSIKVPKSAKEKVILRNPLYLGALITIVLVLIGFLITRIPQKRPDKQLKDLTGMITGIKLNIRTPTKEEWKKYILEKDIVWRLEMIENWRNNEEKTEPVPLEKLKVFITNKRNGMTKEITNLTELEKLQRGEYEIEIVHENYVVSQPDKEKLKNVYVEPTDSLKNITVILLPQYKIHPKSQEN